jgi:RND family efflux transporter MFP subunit
MHRFISQHAPVVALTALSISSLACASPVPEARADTGEPALRVEAAEVVEAPVASYVVLTGTLLARRESDVAADASGKVLSATAERGELVKKGAVLALLDARTAALSAAEAHAQAKLSAAQESLAGADCQRADRLFEGGVISKAEYDRTRTSCTTAVHSTAAAGARAALAGKAVGDATIRAPFGGLIAERYVEAGEYVRADSRIVTIVDIDELRLELTVPESSVAAVAAGQQVDFQVQAFDGQSFGATVKHVGPAMRRASRDLVVEAIAANDDHRLRPGMFATARLRTGETKMAVVPKSALRKQGATQRAYVVANGRIEERVVSVREASIAGRGDLVAIPSGLRAGERVVTRIDEAIADGKRVE